jgi:hypothetical protein
MATFPQQAYTALMQKEHEGETKICERCKRDKPISEFLSPPSPRFLPLCMDCETEISSASKALLRLLLRPKRP